MKLHFTNPENCGLYNSSLKVPEQGLRKRSKTSEQICDTSSNHSDNNIDAMPHSITALTLNERRQNQSPVVITRTHSPYHTPHERPRFVLPSNGEGSSDHLSSEANSDTDFGEDDLSSTDDEAEWDDLETTAVMTPDFCKMNYFITS